MAGLQTCEKAAEAVEVTAFWQELGLPGLVDVHTHFMPPNVQAKVWGVLEQAWPIAYRQPEADRIALLQAFGVRRFGALAYPHKPGMAAWLNAWQAEFAGRTPEALHSATFFPEPGADGYVADAIAAGARLFKAHLQVGGYADRILLGSDSPNIPFPYVHQLQALARLDLGSAWLRGVCHDNAARLLGLSEPEGRGAAWTELRATEERATREGGASKAPRRRAGKHGEPEGQKAPRRAGTL